MSVIHGPSDISLKHRPIPEFPYRRLNAGLLEIRVVTLMPGLKSAPIVCQIDHVVADRTSDDYEKDYNALSYTWGSPDMTRKISLQRIIVQVRENLWQVSRPFLGRSGSRFSTFDIMNFAISDARKSFSISVYSPLPIFILTQHLIGLIPSSIPFRSA
jgi:hypothetical protein